MSALPPGLPTRAQEIALTEQRLRSMGWSRVCKSRDVWIAPPTDATIGPRAGHWCVFQGTDAEAPYHRTTDEKEARSIARQLCAGKEPK